MGILPDNAKTSGAFSVQVSTGGVVSNAVWAPAAAASPGIYSQNGSGYDQAYIVNSDGTLNSPANPAAMGSAITIFATGVGTYTLVNGYTVTALPPTIYIGGFYANGIAAVSGPVDGLPGNVFQISVYVPDPAKFADINPALKDFHFPPRVSVRMGMGTLPQSQVGLYLSVK